MVAWLEYEIVVLSVVSVQCLDMINNSHITLHYTEADSRFNLLMKRSHRSVAVCDWWSFVVLYYSGMISAKWHNLDVSNPQ